MRNKPGSFFIALIAFLLLSLPLFESSAQKASKLEIEEWRDVLRNVKSELKSNYYDPNFHGMDVEARFRAADERLKNAQTLGELVGIVAQVMLDLNDSHTFFIPPFNASRVEYGWRIQPVGDECYVRTVRPGSDAEAKGLRAGDKVLAIDGRPLDRTKVWLADYLYYTLRPQPGMQLLIERPDKKQEEIIIKAKLFEGSRLMPTSAWRESERNEDGEDHLLRHRFHEPNDEVLIWKMPRFDLDEHELANKFEKLKRRKALILDLRGNRGGLVYTLERFAGYFFDSNIKLADRRGRKEYEPMIARSQKDKAFKGQLIVLIDGTSASAAEVFSRVVQLEKRGVVIGDRTSGSVMESRFYGMQVGVKRALAFGALITHADVIMTDGKSLEHVGVTPDELLLPTGQDMSLSLDPVMAHAASLVGLKLDPKRAGELFPVEWKR